METISSNQSVFVLLENSNQSKYPVTASTIAAISAISFAILGFIGNLLTVCVFLCNAKLRRQATSWFIISLSISDMIYCGFNLPLSFTRFVFHKWIYGELMCKLFPFFSYVNLGVSLMHLMLIAINRYVLISNIGTYEKIYSPGRRVLMIIAVYMYCLILVSPPLLGIWGDMGLSKDTDTCSTISKNGKSPKKFIFLVGVLLPFSVVTFCYTKIFRIVQKSKTCFSKKGLKLTKTMTLVFGGYILCFFPITLTNNLDEKMAYPTLRIMALILTWASAVINPFIYVISSRSYREAYFSFLKIKKSVKVQQVPVKPTVANKFSSSTDSVSIQTM